MVPWAEDNAHWSSDPGVPSASLACSLLALPLLLMALGALLTLRALALSLAPVEGVLTIVRTFPPRPVTGAPSHSFFISVHLCIYWLPWPHQVLARRID